MFNKNIFLLLISIIFLFLVFPSIKIDASVGSWTETLSPFSPHEFPSVVMLPNNKLLVVGYDRGTEIYDLQTKSWIVVYGALKELDFDNTATILNTGEVLITGLGNDTNSSDSHYAELFNYNNYTWMQTGNMTNPGRIHSRAILLENGKVLVTGGGYGNNAPSSDSSEIYDRTTNTWSSVSSMLTGRAYHTATLLQNGEVLVTGGGSLSNGTNPLSTTEIYNPSNDTWREVAKMNHPRTGQTATLLKNGKVLVVGGIEISGDNATALSAAELYDPQSNTWTVTSDMHKSRIYHTATLLTDGRVLVTGGESEEQGAVELLNSAEIYDPSSDVWTQVSSMNATRIFHAATLLPNGNVFVVGGRNDKGSEQIGNSIKSAEVFDLAGLPPSATPTPTPEFTMTDFKQNRNADGSNVPWALQNLFNLSSCASMAAEGCAITSVADVIASYGLTNLPDNSVINPGNLNNFLAQNPGTHSGCGIYFNTAGRAVNFTVLHNDFTDVSLQTRIQHIDDALSSKNLVIVGIGGHFVVLYKKAPNSAGDDSPDYYILDPYRYAPYATGDRSGMLLSQAYHSINQLANVLQVVVLDNKTPVPGKSWSIVAHSPVTFLVTDPNGNKTGFDSSSHATVEDIPKSSYGIQQGLIDDIGINAPQPDILYYGQENPGEGTYEVKVTGTGSGEYTLDFAESTGPGNSSLQTVEGTAAMGKTDTYIVTNSSDSNNQPSVSKQVTFDTLRADLFSLYQRGLIDNKGIYNSLKAKIDIAEKASTSNNSLLRFFATKLAFAAIVNELNAQRGKHITDDAYQILFNDINILQNSDTTIVIPTPTPTGGGS